MKKYLVLFLVFSPVVSFAVPSVRHLSGTPALTSAASKTKITPAKSESKPSGAAATISASSARVGTLRAKVKSNDSSSQTTTQGSRFPAIVSSYSYTPVDSPDQGKNYETEAAAQNVNVDQIIEAVTQNITNNYYSKEEVYNREQVDAKIEGIPDDPRFDAIRVVRGRNGVVPSDSDYPTNLPSNYIYMWIEEN